MKQIKLKKIFGLLVLTAALTLAFLPLAQAADITVKVKQTAEVKGSKVLLGDVALIDGPDCALKNDLADIYITRAPAPGRSTSIRDTYLDHRLRTSGLPMDQFEVKMPDKVVVARIFQTLDEMWVRDVFEEYLASIQPYKSTSWELISLSHSPLPKLPQGDVQYRISPFSSSNSSRMVVNIYLSVDGKEVDRIRVTGKIELSVDTVIVTRPLERGQEIRAGDLKLVKMNLSRVPSGALKEIPPAMIMAAKRDLGAGQPVLSRDLEPIAVVHRGDLVTILAESPVIRVTAPGQVQKDAALGEYVSVINLRSKKIVMGKVVGSDLVRVNF
jgi:flagella basal body P-ring formation protein FlgA